MAQVRYNPEDMGKDPTLNLPGAQQIRATPEAFGGGMARATERFGQDIERAGAAADHSLQVFNQVAADDAMNGLQDWTTKRLHGDPNAPNEDGSPNLGYLGLKGRAALDARKPFSEDFEAKIKEIREGLGDDSQRRNFDISAQNLKNDVLGKVSGHADRESATYFQNVNKATADVNLTHIANNADNPAEVQKGLAGVTQAYIKDAQLAGGGDELTQEAVTRAKREAMKAWTRSVAVKDPVKALEILESGKTAAGTYYDELAQEFRAKASAQAGLAAGSGALVKAQSANGYASPTFPAILQAVQTVPGGYSSPQALARVVQVESGGNPSAGAGGSHVGLTQFSEATARQVGITDRHDPAQSIFGAQKYAALNRPVLVKVLHREPIDGELYIAHNQGPAGAAALFANPNMPAADALAPVYHGNRTAAAQAIKSNGGNPEAPSVAFTSMWLRKFGQNVSPTATPATVIGTNLEMPERWQGRGAVPENSPNYPEIIPTHPEQVLADSYRHAMDPASYPEIIRNDPVLLHMAQQHAIETARTTYAAQQVAEAATEKQKKQASDAAARDYSTRIYRGQNIENIVNEMAADQKLEWQTLHTLISIAKQEVGPDRATATRAYGKGFWKAYQQILAPPESQERISDVQTLLNRAAPGADPDDELSLAGVQKLSEVMTSVRKSVDTSNVHEALQAKIKYAQKNLSFNDEMSFPGVAPLKDPEGEKLFYDKFMGSYLSSYDAWVQSGKNPWEFINNPKNVDDLVNSLRSKEKMAAARIAAQRAGSAGMTPEQQKTAETAVLASVPEGVEPAAWKKTVAAVPKDDAGKPYSVLDWGQGLQMLLAAPTQATFQAFNRSVFGAKNGNDAEKLYRELTGKEPPLAAPLNELERKTAEPPKPQQAWDPPVELQEKAAKEKAEKEAHDRLPPWQTSGLAPWEHK